jgi:large conductance mechanosensitive channel
MRVYNCANCNSGDTGLNHDDALFDKEPNMSILSEFKQFAVQGNMVDLAVGVIIGGAFGKIVSSLVADVVMPMIGIFAGGVDFTKLSYVIKPAETLADGKVVEAVTLNYGNFLQTSFDFLIVAIAVFLMVKGINSLRKPATTAEAAAAPPKEETLLTEIRDILKQRSFASV